MRLLVHRDRGCANLENQSRSAIDVTLRTKRLWPSSVHREIAVGARKGTAPGRGLGSPKLGKHPVRPHAELGPEHEELGRNRCPAHIWESAIAVARNPVRMSVQDGVSDQGIEAGNQLVALLDGYGAAPVAAGRVSRFDISCGSGRDRRES